MIRRNLKFFNRLNMLLDALLVVCSYALASWLWLDVITKTATNMAELSGRVLLLACIYAGLLLVMLLILGFYSTTRTRRLGWKLGIIFAAITLSTLTATALFYVFRLVDFSRGVLLLFYVFSLGSVCGKYIVMRVLFRWLRGRGYNLKHVIVIGTGRLAKQYAEDTVRERSLGLHVKGFVGPFLPDVSPYLGDFSQLDGQLKMLDVDEAVIALEPEDYARIRELIAICDKNGVKYYVIPFYNDIIPEHPYIESIGRSKLIDMRSNRLENVGWALIKRSFDLIASALGLIVLSPLMLALAIGVKLSSPGPILFKQVRVGYKRREFKMLKFRSMVVNSSDTTAWSTNADNRRTPFGRWIRKTSLDELPQLINVLKGDMSLVGPRPELPHFVEQFRETIPLYMVKHQVLPGLTGWAQIHGYRGDTSIEKRIELDLWYIEHWSVWLDICIIFRTLFGGMINQEEVAPPEKDQQPE